MGHRYCSKENYLKCASDAENGIFGGLVINDCDLKLMRNAEKRVGWSERFTLGDCSIISVDIEGNDLIIGLNNTQGYVKYNKLILKNGVIVEQEYPLVGSFFLNHDLYFENGLFTFYCLIWSPESQEPQGLGYLTFTATDIKVGY